MPRCDWMDNSKNGSWKQNNPLLWGLKCGQLSSSSTESAVSFQGISSESYTGKDGGPRENSEPSLHLLNIKLLSSERVSRS